MNALDIAEKQNFRAEKLPDKKEWDKTFGKRAARKWVQNMVIDYFCDRFQPKPGDPPRSVSDATKIFAKHIIKALERPKKPRARKSFPCY